MQLKPGVLVDVTLSEFAEGPSFASREPLRLNIGALDHIGHLIASNLPRFLETDGIDTADGVPARATVESINELEGLGTGGRDLEGQTFLERVPIECPLLAGPNVLHEQRVQLPPPRV